MRPKLLASLLVFVCASAFAQSVGGLAGISGVVRDPSSASVPNAKVVISNDTQGVVRSLMTNSEGVFTAAALAPGGGYKVTVTAKGFNTSELTNLELKVGQNMDLRVNLTVGQAVTQIEVTAAAALIDDSKTDVSTVVGTQQIQDLPINGRRVDSFVLLTPGVTNDGTFGLLTFRGVAGHNAFLVDGNDNTEQFYNENAGRTRIASQISQDAVQEFQVVSSNYSAAYGGAMGGVVNTVTKSGTNQLHGGAFWYYRSTGFNARDPFSAFTPSEKRNQLGAYGGGALIKDKLFYFLSVDITRRNFPMVDTLTNAGVIDPINQVWVGCNAPYNGVTPTAAQCSAINSLLPRFFGSIPRTGHNDLYFGRLDYHLSERHTFSGSFNYLRWASPNGIQTGATSTSGSAINGNGDDYVRVRNGRFTWTYVPTSSFVNEFRWGWSTDRQADTFDNSLLGSGIGLLNVSVAGSQLGPANYLPRVEPNEQRFQFVDNATWTKGNHTIKFGADISTVEDYTYYISNYFGNYTYQTVAAFALDYSGNTTGMKNWQRYQQTFGNPVVDGSITNFGFYAEDQWRASNRLTVTLGARYEYSKLPQPPMTNPDWPQTGHINSSSLNLAPRVGLAYRLNDKTVLRAGYGLFYARFLGSVIDNLWTGNGIYQTSDTLNNTSAPQLAAGPVFPNPLAAPPSGASVGASTLQFAAPNLRSPYSQQGDISIDRQLSRDIAVTGSYIWSHGTRLYGVQDLNAPALGPTKVYSITDVNGNPVAAYATQVYVGTRPNTKYGGVYEDTNGVDSYYNALAITVNKRFSHGLQALASYTWAHEIDDGQSNGSGALFFSNANNWTYNGDYRFDKGSGSLDQRHRVVLSFVWAPTFTHRTDAFSRYVVNNWQFASITTLAAGRPNGSLTVRVTDTPVAGMLSSSSLNGFGGNFRVPFYPVDSLYTPPNYKDDIRISKILPFQDGKYKLYLNGEAFNISNSISYTGLSSQAFTEKGGILTPTPTANGVGTQDGGFPDGTQARRLQVSMRFVF
jgi:outer membrane receptor protein involved in Fe transport